MSIFKETFKDFIFRKLGIREAIVQLGNNKSSRFNSLNEINVKNRKETINVPRGAFYTNSISRASKTMNDCRQINKSSKKTGTDN